MKRFIFTGLVSFALAASLAIDAPARGPRGGGGGSRGGMSRGGGGGGMSRGGGGGMSRGGGGGGMSGRSPSMSRTPSRGSSGFPSGGSRPGGSQLGGSGGSKPAGFQFGGSKPGGSGGSKPGGSGGSKPGGFQFGGSNATQPGGFQFGGSRPGGSDGFKPGGSAFERPGGATQPSAGADRGPGNKGPSDKQPGGFLDMPRDRDVGQRDSVADRRTDTDRQSNQGDRQSNQADRQSNQADRRTDQTDRRTDRKTDQTDRRTDRKTDQTDRRQESVENRTDRLNDRGDTVRDQTRDRGDLMSDQWRDRQKVNNRWGYADRHPASYWRRPATWAGVTGWFGGSWGEPMYYDYGGETYYEDGGVYQDGQEVATAEQYAQQAQQIAQQPVEETAESADWMPLGVFAMVREKETKASMFLELAVSKEGTITGTYSNTISDTAQPIEGHVDLKTQRAAWWIGSNQNNILETGIYNLTKDETPVLVHFGDQQTQTWLLVRLEDSTENASKNP